jgi:hypothetical protein
MVSYLYQSPSGIPGDVTRPDESNIEPVTLVSPFPANYGLPMKYATGASGAPEAVTPMAASDAASVFCGILTRQAPAISGSSVNESFYTDEPNPVQIQGLCVRGYVSVLVNAGSPVRGQSVYVVQTASAGHPAGALEVGSNGGNNVALTGTIVGNVTWAADGVDSNGFGEVRIAQ